MKTFWMTIKVIGREDWQQPNARMRTSEELPRVGDYVRPLRTDPAMYRVVRVVVEDGAIDTPYTVYVAEPEPLPTRADADDRREIGEGISDGGVQLSFAWSLTASQRGEAYEFMNKALGWAAEHRAEKETQ